MSSATPSSDQPPLPSRTASEIACRLVLVTSERANLIVEGRVEVAEFKDARANQSVDADATAIEITALCLVPVYMELISKLLTRIWNIRNQRQGRWKRSYH